MLFPPFYLLATNDIHDHAGEALRDWNLGTLPNRDHDTAARVSKINDSYKWESLAKMGRPAWHLHLRNGQTRDRMIGLAALKLGDGSNTMTAPIAAGILSSRICLRVVPHSELASTLIASHMATCIDVSDDQSRVTILYNSDPILAFGAQLHWKSDKLAQCFKHLLELYHFAQTAGNKR